jgi:hypothetical protein
MDNRYKMYYIGANKQGIQKKMDPGKRLKLSVKRWGRSELALVLARDNKCCGVDILRLPIEGRV